LYSFLKVYIRALQQGSDLDDTVEEKLLIGDRPKLTPEMTNGRTLKERLVDRPEAELAEVIKVMYLNEQH
jgi:N-terminal acetyltransferase B complex non-catalytic subunit